jgi:hypothetical protein
MLKIGTGQGHASGGQRLPAAHHRPRRISVALSRLRKLVLCARGGAMINDRYLCSHRFCRLQQDYPSLNPPPSSAGRQVPELPRAYNLQSFGFFVQLEHFPVPGNQDFCLCLERRADHQQIVLRASTPATREASAGLGSHARSSRSLSPLSPARRTFALTPHAVPPAPPLPSPAHAPAKLAAARRRIGPACQTRSRAHWCRERLSRHPIENILIGQIAAGLREWHYAPTKLLEPKLRKVALERLAYYLATGSP